MEQSYVSTPPPTSEISFLLHPSLIVASQTGSKYLKHENLKGMSRKKNLYLGGLSFHSSAKSNKDLKEPAHFKPFLHLHESVHDLFFFFFLQQMFWIEATGALFYFQRVLVSLSAVKTDTDLLIDLHVFSQY